MASYNKVVLMGNVVKEPELRQTTQGNPVVNLRLAVNTKLGQDKERQLFIDVAVFGKLAEVVGKYVTKGSNILVEGRLDEDQWTTESNERRFKHFITASAITFLNLKNGDSTDSSKVHDSTF